MANVLIDPNISTISAAGLAIESKANIISWLVSQFQAIYGSDINVASNSPDGQLINIFAQASIDQLELLLDTYNGFAVDTAYGTRLDQLVALNGIARQAGTYTQANVLVTVSGAVTLPGLDQTVVPAFTVADGAGNQFQLITSYVFSVAGSATLLFKSVTIGLIPTTANTITNISTSTLGVTSVNNPVVSADIIGSNEETDAQLKIRHNQSFTLAATGMSDSMESALRNLPGMVDAYVAENNTPASVNLIPPNSIWVVTNGGTPASIAQAIYSKKSPGCGMKGTQTYNVLRPNGSNFVAQWDNAIAQGMYVAFSVIWKGPQLLSSAQIIQQLSSLIIYKLGQNPCIGDFVSAMQSIAPTAVISINATQGVSTDNVHWNSIIYPANQMYYFYVIPSSFTLS